MMNSLVTADQGKFLAIAEALVRDAKQQRFNNDNFKQEIRQELSQLKSVLETQVVLAPIQATSLKRAVEARVRFHLSDEKAYRDHSKKLFTALWRDIRNAFAVAQYREIPRVHFDAAISYVKTWYPQMSKALDGELRRGA